MAQIKEKVKRVLRDYLVKVQREIPVEFAVLYGSQAKGKARPDSDIDIAIFSSKFKNKSYYKAQVMLQKFLWGIKADIQPVGYSLEEFSSKDKLDFVGGVIKKEGRVVCRKNKILI
ncbi:MAG: nucleotidyltransferase domain-containing protein [Nitrospirae bacterium]|nr:nucleotidyltransferase domain-containing protein [Nitrospirota bacterium]